MGNALLLTSRWAMLSLPLGAPEGCWAPFQVLALCLSSTCPPCSHLAAKESLPTSQPPCSHLAHLACPPCSHLACPPCSQGKLSSTCPPCSQGKLSSTCPPCSQGKLRRLNARPCARLGPLHSPNMHARAHACMILSMPEHTKTRMHTMTRACGAPL